MEICFATEIFILYSHSWCGYVRVKKKKKKNKENEDAISLKFSDTNNTISDRQEIVFTIVSYAKSQTKQGFLTLPAPIKRRNFFFRSSFPAKSAFSQLFADKTYGNVTKRIYFTGYLYRMMTVKFCFSLNSYSMPK